MARKLLTFVFFFIIFLVFSGNILCNDYDLKEKAVVSLVQKYDLSKTNNIAFEPVASAHNLKPFKVAPQDIPAFLEVLKTAKFRPGAACKCQGIYTIIFSTEKGNIKFKYAHERNFENQDGIYELGDAFVEFMDAKYFP